MRGCDMGFFDNKKVTLFNCWMNPETEEEKYYRTLLDGVDIVETKQANVSKDGKDSVDVVKLYIDMDKMPKPYQSPRVWKALEEEGKKTHITFTPATDFFVKGDCTGATLPDESVYEWMRDNYDDVYMINTVEKYEDILPHFEVGGV